MAEGKRQGQREVNLGSPEYGLPPRGTGRETGRARPNLTDEERADRHAFIDACMKEGKTQAQCVEEWSSQNPK
ncbi:hypothetical protein KKH23_08830 [Patescibacteria group bacterium]|uniref:Uncharacterized protein n=1 Tax=viral metagenome TaxID=1070528 RepID=A0A6M3MHD0_9ZZZZ|nr:hypothetical protein [Patescibacteria group bacterium]